jgi:hypothetical protein
MTEQLTLLPEDFPAKMCQQPEAKEGLVKEPEAVYGANVLGLLAYISPDTQSLKTLQTCLMGTEDNGSPLFSMIWPRAGMMRSGNVYELAPLDYPINEIEFGYLPTPQKSDGTFLKIRRPLALKCGAYRITSNQGIDGNAKLADIAWNVWGGQLNPEYVEAMMGYPMMHTALEASETP